MIPFWRVKEEALTHQVPIVGVLRPREMPAVRNALIRRREEGQLSGFEPDPDLVGNPERVMAEVQSILVLGLPYCLSDAAASRSEEVSRVASVAWGYDYHDHVREKLARMAAWLESQGSRHNMFFCDTGPLNDRHLAFLAGLGTYGRHQLLIHPRYGSAVVYGYLLTDLVLEASCCEPQTYAFSRCGTCQACQAACPTGALKGAFDFVASHCISNLTQQKRALSEAEMASLGTWLYGCDLCQLACPMNHQADGFAKRLGAKTPNYLNPFLLLEMGSKDFKIKFRGQGFAWRGLKTLQRNALINLFNSRQPAQMATLESLVANGRLPAHLNELYHTLKLSVGR